MKIIKLLSLSLSLFMLAGCGATAAQPTQSTEAPTETPTEASTESASQWPEPDKLIALTFDDGPSTKTMVEVLDALDKYDVKATFFVIAKKINNSTIPVMERAIASGHEIGNHSLNHLKMGTLTDEEILKEYTECQRIVKENFGLDLHFFRAPYGSVNDSMYELIPAPFITGYSTGDGTIGSIAEDRAYKAINGAYDGAIIVMHCFQGNDETVKALDILIPELKAQGYKFVTLSNLFTEAGYEIPGPTPGTKIKNNKPIE